jgi:hypothetical protein
VGVFKSPRFGGAGDKKMRGKKILGFCARAGGKNKAEEKHE